MQNADALTSNASQGEEDVMPKELKQYPLVHRMSSSLNLSMDSTAKCATIIPIAIANKNKADAYTINTNPYHTDRVGIQETPMCYLDSVISKYRIGMSVSMPVAGQEAGIQAVRWRLGLIAASFDDVDKEDKIGLTDVKTILQLESDANEYYCRPIYNGTDISPFDMYSGATSEMGLTTNSLLEGVAFDDDAYFDAIRQGTLKGALKKVMPFGLQEQIIYKDRPYRMAKTWFDMPGHTKRMNENTFVGLLVEVPQSNATDEQFYTSTETGDGISHLRIGYDIYYNEYNNDFVRS